MVGGLGALDHRLPLGGHSLHDRPVSQADLGGSGPGSRELLARDRALAAPLRRLHAAGRAARGPHGLARGVLGGGGGDRGLLPGHLAGWIPLRRHRELRRGLRGGRGPAADRGDPEPLHRRESPAGVPRGADTVAAASGGGRKLMGYSTILIDRTDGVATITLNRPQARNALDLVMRRELLTALDELEAEPAVRVVILTGGGGHFSAGGDVKTMAAKRQTAAEGRARVESLNRFIIRLFEYPKPTIAMVDGFAVGAGCNIALGCDIVIASDRARFGEVFAKIGLVPD